LRSLGLIVSARALLSAMALIALTEGLRIRSSLFYAVMGGLGFVALYYGLGLAERDVALGRDLEIMAGAGIAAGVVYWALPRRQAGCSRGQTAPAKPSWTHETHRQRPPPTRPTGNRTNRGL